VGHNEFKKKNGFGFAFYIASYQLFNLFTT